MPSLTRRPDEYIMIGDHIKITVANVRGNNVLLRVTAPPEVRIDRGEVHEERKRQAQGLERGAGPCDR